MSPRIALLACLLLLAGAAPAPAQSAAWRLVREVRIGAVDGPEEYTFSFRPRVTARRDGTIFVVDEGAKQVRAYDARGRHLRSFGGAGEGPGEFQGIDEVGWVGDTLWVTDPMQLRTTPFTPTGRVVRTIGQVVRATRDFYPASAWALLADGSMLALPSPAENDPVDEPFPSLPLPLLRLERGSGRVDTLSWVDVGKRNFAYPCRGESGCSWPSRGMTALSQRLRPTARQSSKWTAP